MKIMHPLKAALFAVLLLAAIVPAASAATPASTLPAAAVKVGWATFLSHATSVTNAESSIGDDLSFDLDIEDMDSAAAHYRQMASTARREKTWIATHRPSACFASVWSAWSNMQSHIYAYAVPLGRWAGAYPYGRTGDYNSGMSHLRSATSWTNTVSARLKKTSC